MSKFTRDINKNNNQDNNGSMPRLPLLGTDLSLADYYLGADLYIGKDGDLEITSDEMNIAQAILHRLRTIKGELADLGHPDYGSTILDFIGQPNNSVTRGRLRLAIRDAIRQEHRIRELISIDVKQRLPDISTSRRFSQLSESKLEKQRVTVLTSGPTSTVAAKAERGEAIKIGRDEKAEGVQLHDTIDDNNNDNNEANRVNYENLVLDSKEILNSVDVEIVVIPVGSTTPIQIGFPFNLESATPIQIGGRFPLSQEAVK